MLTHDLLRGGVQEARTAVVAQTGPAGQHAFEWRVGESVYVGKALQESRVIWRGGRDLRLLQHDLAHPDAIGIARLAPRHGALLAMEPGK
jgi:hypothetical protein